MAALHSRYINRQNMRSPGGNQTLIKVKVPTSNRLIIMHEVTHKSAWQQIFKEPKPHHRFLRH